MKCSKVSTRQEVSTCQIDLESLCHVACGYLDIRDALYVDQVTQTRRRCFNGGEYIGPFVSAKNSENNECIWTERKMGIAHQTKKDIWELKPDIVFA